MSILCLNLKLCIYCAFVTPLEVSSCYGLKAPSGVCVAKDSYKGLADCRTLQFIALFFSAPVGVDILP